MGSFRESMTGDTTMREVGERELGEEVVVVGALSQGTPITDESGDGSGETLR